ncbi:hypothetical protein FV226_25955 [Methylobacterium sp. WL12]|uniref:hypothetical protein n=1 Tax=Methylobacterium sp. WL12 TaxID=2603890 RepID=UPI0011CADE8C|nr:hypothetical protein [Methylobacterium sp. WL12]TXM64830.1 hypothetical protein FV226_25955 [Methylobacterium sp. WL12]
MRTSRDSESHRRFILSELLAGRLRQGWGYLPEQDLRLIRDRHADPAIGYAGLTDDEKWAWGHWRMSGGVATPPSASFQVDDIVLIPNVPGDGSFSLCRVAGPYTYDIPTAVGDLGHVRQVENLTKAGVAYTSELVSAPLRRSLSCRSRLWNLDEHRECLEGILAAIAAGGQVDGVMRATNHLERAQRATAGAVETSLAGLTAAITEPLRAVLKSAEWEPVLKSALVPLLRDVDVIHTGGAGEQGADIEIHIPNPFLPDAPWIVAVQLKDYVGEIPGYVADQIEQAITARLDGGRQGGILVSVILASTSAGPSEDLTQRLTDLQTKYRLQVACVHGPDLMRVLARGMLSRMR